MPPPCSLYEVCKRKRFPNSLRSKLSIYSLDNEPLLDRFDLGFGCQDLSKLLVLVTLRCCAKARREGHSAGIVSNTGVYEVQTLQTCTAEIIHILSLSCFCCMSTRLLHKQHHLLKIPRFRRITLWSQWVKTTIFVYTTSRHRGDLIKSWTRCFLLSHKPVDCSRSLRRSRNLTQRLVLGVDSLDDRHICPVFYQHIVRSEGRKGRERKAQGQGSKLKAAHRTLGLARMAICLAGCADAECHSQPCLAIHLVTRRIGRGWMQA